MTPDPAAVSIEEIARRRDGVLARIEAAARRRGRDPGEVALMAVTKGHGVETAANAARAGLTLFGENRVQEGAAKIAYLRAEFPRLTWRLIGPLQTNKVRTALQWFSVVESLDRERLAARLESLLEEEGRRLPVLLEVNVGSEASKSGVRPGEAGKLLEVARACPHLDVRGLMAVPPYDPDPEKARPYFSELARLRASLAKKSGQPLPELSIGMSHDLEVAVEEGATEVRVGTALFGPRAVQ
jgi:pyridoxal phosphate enzyme (YggS family)